MATIIRIDDAVLRGLLADRNLWKDFPRFEQLNTKYNNAPKASTCRCRRGSNQGLAVLAEAKTYIRFSSPEAKNKLKAHLKADYIKLLVTDNTGKHTDYTW